MLQLYDILFEPVCTYGQVLNILKAPEPAPLCAKRKGKDPEREANDKHAAGAKNGACGAEGSGLRFEGI